MTLRKGGDVVLLVWRVVLLGLLLCWVLFLCGVAIVRPHPLPRGVSAPLEHLSFYRNNVEIVRYVDGERTLTVTEHAPRDLLVCLRGDCRLVEEWLGK